MLGTLQIKSRPLRLGLLVDLRNNASLKQAITVNSTVWGGYYNPLIPIFKKTPQAWTDKTFSAPTPKSIFEGYMRAFDPDVLVKCLEGDLPDYAKNSGRRLTASNEIWLTDQDRRFEPSWGVGLFDLLRLIYEKHFQFIEKFPHEVKLLILPGSYQLFWGAVFGIVPDPIDELLTKHYAGAFDIHKEPACMTTLKKFLQNPRIFYPHRITRYGLTAIRRSGMWDIDNVFFMDANRALDIVDFWNLRAAGRRVIPVPRQFSGDEHLDEIVRDFLNFANRPVPRNPAIEMMGTFIRSRSVPMEEMEAYWKKLQLGATSLKASLQHWYPRIWDDFGRDADHAEPVGLHFDEKEIELRDSREARFTAVVPDFLERFGISDEPRLANDIHVRVYGADEYVASVVPPNSGENVMRTVAEFGAFENDWRIGCEGLIKLVKYNSSVLWTVPLAQDVFFAWLRDLGWTPEASPPGLLANQIHKQLGGWTAWLNENALHFLEKMSAGKYADRGADVSEIQNRIAAVGGRLGSLLPGEHLFNQLSERDVFVVGYENKCPTCFRHSWHSLKDLDRTLTCPKCLHNYRADRHITRGNWKYKTAGPFSIGGYADGAYCVLASIDFFARQLHHLALTPGMSFRATKSGAEDLEADFGMLWREENIKGRSEGVIFGECKSFGEFKDDDFKRMRKFATDFPGAVLVFSTFRKNLTEREKSQIKKIAKRGRKYWKSERPINPVCVITGHELLDHIGPPYCWRDLGLEEKFRWIVGLMDFCNATQQIHLGMPNWHADWQKKWEERRRRRAAKLAK